MKKKLSLVLATVLSVATIATNAILAPDVVINTNDHTIEFQTEQDYVTFKMDLIQKHKNQMLSIQGYSLLKDVYNYELQGEKVVLTPAEMQDVISTMNAKITINQ